MVRESTEDDEQIIVTRTGHRVTPIKSDTSSKYTSAGVEFHIWQQIVPVTLSQHPEICDELFNLGLQDAVSFDAIDELKSLFNLVGLLSASGGAAPAEDLARGWMCIPLSERAAWDCISFADKPIHGQIFGRLWPARSLDSTQVPEWLPNLLEATELVCFRSGPVWTHAVTPLGTSCIAYRNVAIDDHKACFALSNCPIHYELVDDDRRSQALAAVEKLIRRLEALEDDPGLAEAISWQVTGHQLMLMSSTLDKWREDIRSA